ncbi:MAG: hypothetical protein NTZ60_08410 [Campylobacterales bacterium]|nr:hypothetical protein [Campylobacterales bacterium]
MKKNLGKFLLDFLQNSLFRLLHFVRNDCHCEEERRSNLIFARSLLVFLALWHVELFASTYLWHVETDKKSAFVNEPIYLKYSCEFSDRAELYAIDFNPVGENEKYSLKLLSQNTKVIDGKKIVSYEFIAFAKKVGALEFEFEALMKETNKDSIENRNLGRDNMDHVEYSTVTLRQEILSVDVLESASDLVGSFVLEVKKDEPKIKAHEPFHMEIIVKGEGNFEALKAYDFNISGVKIFSQKPIENITLTKDGFSGVWSQKFAFVSEKDFEIPQIFLHYFDAKEQKIKEMKQDALSVQVSEGFVKEELLDADEAQMSFLKLDYLYYFLTFITGFLVAKIKIRKRVPHAIDAFAEKVQNAKSLEELCMILVLKDAQKYSDFVLKIETKEITSLKIAKEIVALLIVH